MGRAITKEDYDAITAAFRKMPANFSGASRATGCCRATCRRAWEVGWPRYGFTAVREVLAQEAAEVRRRMEEVAERERKAAERERALRPTVDAERDRADSMMRREQWAQACKASRANAQLMLVTVNDLLKTAFAQADKVKKALAAADLPPSQWVKLTRDLVSAGRQVTEALHLTLQTEHLALGQPTEIVGLQPMELTLEEAEREIAAAQRAVERARQRRQLPPHADGTILDADVLDATTTLAPSHGDPLSAAPSPPSTSPRQPPPAPNDDAASSPEGEERNPETSAAGTGTPPPASQSPTGNGRIKRASGGAVSVQRVVMRPERVQLTFGVVSGAERGVEVEERGEAGEVAPSEGEVHRVG